MIISRVRVCESACRFQSAAVPTRLSCHVSQLTTSRIAWQHTKMPAVTSHTDIILPMGDPYMEQIVDGTKNHEFRKYRLKSGIRQVWLYRTAPHSSITHICEILPARPRNPSATPNTTLATQIGTATILRTRSCPFGNSSSQSHWPR
jgi:hypothetical protein